MGQVLFFGKEPDLKKDFNIYQRRLIHVMLCKGMGGRTATGIYRLWFNDKFYIGRANNIRTRVKQHMKDIEYGYYLKKPKGWFHAAVFKFLDNNPDFSIMQLEILEECEEDSLNEKEQLWLDKFSGDPNMLNIDTTAKRTFQDKARDDFKQGIYRIDFPVNSLGSYMNYKKLVKELNAINHGFLK